MACHRPSTDVGLGLVMRETWVYVAPQFLTVILAAAYGHCLFAVAYFNRFLSFVLNDIARLSSVIA